jgi:hypothetical protein
MLHITPHSVDTALSSSDLLCVIRVLRTREHIAVNVQRIQHIDCVWNVMAHAQEPDFVFRRNGRVHLKREGRQSSRLLAAEVCASAIVMLDTPFSEVVWRVLATHFIRQFPLHFPSRASQCTITSQLNSKTTPNSDGTNVDIGHTKTRYNIPTFEVSTAV